MSHHISFSISKEFDFNLTNVGMREEKNKGDINNSIDFNFSFIIFW